MSEPIRVLLVDDEESFRTQMAERLIKRGFQVEEAGSGPEALARAHACRGDYQVAVIDQVMGPPNGIETMQKLLQSYPAIEVIILTGWGDLEPGLQAIQMGAYRFMSRPADPTELAFNIQIAARYGRERQRRLALETLVQAGQHISQAQNEDDLYRRLYDATKPLLPALDGFIIAEYDGYNQVVSFPFVRVLDEYRSLRPRRDHNGLTEFVLRNGRPLFLPDGDLTFRKENGLQLSSILDVQCTSKIVVPMFVVGKPVAIVNAMTFRPGIRYTPQHLEILQAFANQAIVALQNVRQLDEAQRLRDAAAALSGQRGREAVLRAIDTEAHKLIRSDFTGLTLQDEHGKLYKAQPVIPEDYFNRFEEPRQQGGVSRAVVEARQPRIIPDTSKDPLVKDSVRAAGIKAMLAMPLVYGERVLGVLYAHYFTVQYFKPHDVNLWSTFATLAATSLQSAIEEEREAERLNRKLRAIVNVFQAYREQHETQALLESIARAMKTALEVDVVTVLDYDPETKKFTYARGAAGLQSETGTYTPPDAETFIRRFLKNPDYTYIPDVSMDEWMQASYFVRRERDIQSTIVFPLQIDEQLLGFLFASYRDRKTLTEIRVEDIRLFADFAAAVLYEAWLQRKLTQTQRRLERRTFLNWVSMVGTTWRHSIVQKSAAIRNYKAVIERHITALGPSLPDVDGICKILNEIDVLAQDISNASPQVPQSWELEAEFFPLAPLLTEVAQRESKHFPQQLGSHVRVTVEVEALEGVLIRGYRRWLINALELLLQNTRAATPPDGAVTVSGHRVEQCAEVRIRDTGCGVPQTIRRKLFKEPVFSQYSAGMGLGCLLAATIIEEHEGQIALESTGPSGTTVLFKLPIVGKVD